MARLGRVRLVLIETSLSANIGAVARAMKTMGLSQLWRWCARSRRSMPRRWRARPEPTICWPHARSVHETLTDALSGCRLVIGSSARARTLAWPQLDPAGCGETLVREAACGEVALLLGRERSGLTNDELACCHYLARIPANPDYASLNIAAAAQVFAYEMRRSALAQAVAGGGPAHSAGSPPPAAAAADGFGPEAPLATAEEMDGFHAHLERTLLAIGYADPKQSARLLRRLRRLVQSRPPGPDRAQHPARDPGRGRRAPGARAVPRLSRAADPRLRCPRAGVPRAC